MEPAEESRRTPGEPPGGSARETRIERMLEERLAEPHRREMAREVAAHDRQRPAGEGFDRERVRRRLRFRGRVPDKLKAALREAIPGVLAHAAAQGVAPRDPDYEVVLLDRAGYEAERGAPVPARVPLPASSVRQHPVSRRYTVRVVLADRPPGTGEVAATVRVVMARLLGDIFLREEVFSREAWREDLAATEHEVSAGPADRIRLLGEVGHTPPALGEALARYGQQVGMAYRRHPDKVRRAWLADALHDLEGHRLHPATEALIDEAFEAFLADVRGDPEAAVEAAAADVEALNRQTAFLPPDEAPDHLLLRRRKPLHYLRAAKLRLESVLELLAAFLEGFGELEAADTAVNPLLDEHLEDHLTWMRREGLARPYLVPNARLSEALARQRDAFPFEVHALVQRMPGVDNPERAYHSLRRRIERSLYQRLYAAMLDMRQWIGLREQGRGDDFRGTGRHRHLAGQVGNFRYRLPALEGLNVRLGVVLDALEGRYGDEANRNRLPVDTVARAWSYFVAARATTGGLAGMRRMLPRFDPGRFRAAVDDAVLRGLERGAGHEPLVLLFTHLCDAWGADGLRRLGELLREPSGTFRFAVNRVLQASPGDAAARREQVRLWAGRVVQAEARRRANAIVVGDASPPDAVSGD